MMDQRLKSATKKDMKYRMEQAYLLCMIVCVHRSTLIIENGSSALHGSLLLNSMLSFIFKTVLYIGLSREVRKFGNNSKLKWSSVI